MNDSSRLPAVTDSFGGALMRVALDHLKQLPAAWPTLPELEQARIIGALRTDVQKAVAEGVRTTVAFGFPSAEVGVESLTIKSAGKVTLSLSDPQTLHDLVDAVGRKCVLVLIDPADFLQGMEQFRAEADQPELPLDAPEGDSVNAGGSLGEPVTADDEE